MHVCESGHRLQDMMHSCFLTFHQLHRYKTGKEAKSRRQLWHAVLSGRSFQQSMLNSINREIQHITSRWQHQGVGKVCKSLHLNRPGLLHQRYIPQ